VKLLLSMLGRLGVDEDFLFSFKAPRLSGLMKLFVGCVVANPQSLKDAVAVAAKEGNNAPCSLGPPRVLPRVPPARERELLSFQSSSGACAMAVDTREMPWAYHEEPGRAFVFGVFGSRVPLADGVFFRVSDMPVSLNEATGDAIGVLKSSAELFEGLSS